MTVQPWVCARCDAAGNTGAFCFHCGAPQAVAQPVVTAPPVASPPAAPSYPVPSYPVTQQSPVPPSTHRELGAPRVDRGASFGSSTAPDIPLLPGERVDLDISFSPHLILSHLRTRVLLTEHRVVVQSPHALFGIIPMGYACASAPLNEISQINHGHMARSGRVAAGAGIAIFGLLLAVSEHGGGAFLMMLLMLGIGAALIITSRLVGIFFDTGGNHLMAARGRGGDIADVQRTAQTVIASMQRAHGHG